MDRRGQDLWDGTGKSWLYLILISCRHKAGVPSAVRARHWLPSLPVTAFIYSTQVRNKWQGHTHHHHTHRAHVPNSEGGGGGAAPRLIQKCEHVWPLLWCMSLSLGNVRDVSRWSVPEEDVADGKQTQQSMMILQMACPKLNQNANYRTISLYTPIENWNFYISVRFLAPFDHVKITGGDTAT